MTAHCRTLPATRLPIGGCITATLSHMSLFCSRATSTPLWRKFGPVKFLCMCLCNCLPATLACPFIASFLHLTTIFLEGNACGLYYKVNGDHRPYYMSKNKLNSSAKKSLLRCSNCGTNKTTMWRKVSACNLDQTRMQRDCINQDRL